MNWYKIAQITYNDYGEPKFKWPKGWKCSVKKEKDGLYWASLRFDNNLVQSAPGDYPTKARTNAFHWLEWYLKKGKDSIYLK